jgi:hypothetical protein
MCCFAALLVIAGPRLAMFFWWLLEPARWSATFDTFVLPLVGFLFVPWTTLIYVAVFPGGIDGFDWVWLGLGLFLDIASWTGGGYSGRQRYTSA